LMMTIIFIEKHLLNTNDMQSSDIIPGKSVKRLQETELSHVRCPNAAVDGPYPCDE
jgi:hypothetical protein